MFISSDQHILWRAFQSGFTCDLLKHTHLNIWPIANLKMFIISALRKGQDEWLKKLAHNVLKFFFIYFVCNKSETHAWFKAGQILNARGVILLCSMGLNIMCQCFVHIFTTRTLNMSDISRKSHSFNPWLKNSNVSTSQDKNNVIYFPVSQTWLESCQSPLAKYPGAHCSVTCH